MHGSLLTGQMPGRVTPQGCDSGQFARSCFPRGALGSVARGWNPPGWPIPRDREGTDLTFVLNKPFHLELLR